jgi:hypothetical protein
LYRARWLLTCRQLYQDDRLHLSHAYAPKFVKNEVVKKEAEVIAEEFRRIAGYHRDLQRQSAVAQASAMV